MRRIRRPTAEWSWPKPLGDIQLADIPHRIRVIAAVPPRAGIPSRTSLTYETCEDGAPILEWTSCHPRRLPDLHRRFAAIAIDPRPERAALAFARRFGFLGAESVLSRSEAKFLEMAMDVEVFCERLDFWLDSAYKVHRLVHFYDIVRFRRRDDAAQVIRWEDSPAAVWYEPGPPGGVRRPEVPSGLHRSHVHTRRLAHEGDHLGERFTIAHADGGGFVITSEPATLRGSELIERFTASDCYLEPLRFAIITEVAAVLRKHTHVDVLPFVPEPVEVVPNHLLAAIYLSLADELQNRHLQLRKCASPGCPEFFAPEDARQRYHDPICRKRTWDRAKRHRPQKPTR